MAAAAVRYCQRTLSRGGPPAIMFGPSTMMSPVKRDLGRRRGAAGEECNSNKKCKILKPSFQGLEVEFTSDSKKFFGSSSLTIEYSPVAVSDMTVNLASEKHFGSVGFAHTGRQDFVAYLFRRNFRPRMQDGSNLVRWAM